VSRLDDGACENRPTPALQLSDSLCDVKSLNIHGDAEKLSRDTLRTLSPNVCLTRLNVDHDLAKTCASVAVKHTNVKSPLRRDLLMRRALNDSHYHDDIAMATKSKRHSASKSRAKCRCFGRPMVCSVCITRSDVIR